MELPQLQRYMVPETAALACSMAHQGICGRGVLLDYVGYAERNVIQYTTFSDHAISL